MHLFDIGGVDERLQVRQDILARFKLEGRGLDGKDTDVSRGGGTRRVDSSHGTALMQMVER